LEQIDELNEKFQSSLDRLKLEVDQEAKENFNKFIGVIGLNKNYRQ